MTKLEIKETKSAPSVLLDIESGRFEIRGNSFLDNAHEFFVPVLNWMKEYEKNPLPETKVLFDLTYINTSSQRMVFDFLKLLNNMHKAGHKVLVEWLYDENDEDLRDVGNDLLSFMDFPFKVLVKVS